MARQASQEIVPIEQYSVMQIDPAELREALEDNLGGEQITEFDLPTVKLPSGGQMAWVVPGVQGDEIVKELEGIVLAHKWTRSFWANSIDTAGGGQPPDCSAPDARNGYGYPFLRAGEETTEMEPRTMRCEECPNSKRGSGRNGGQACQLRKLIMLLPPTGVLPRVVNLAPTSTQPAKDFFLGLSGLTPIVNWRRAHVKIGLEKARNKDGVDYAKATFELVDAIDDEVFDRIKAISEVFGAAFEQARIVNAAGDVAPV